MFLGSTSMPITSVSSENAYLLSKNVILGQFLLILTTLCHFLIASELIICFLGSKLHEKHVGVVRLQFRRHIKVKI